MTQPVPAPISDTLAVISTIQSPDIIRRKPVNEHAPHSTQEPSNREHSNGAAVVPTSEKRAAPKYHHIVAVHAKVRTSCLSHDSAASPSFLGFRNLMVIVLSERSFHLNWNRPSLRILNNASPFCSMHWFHPFGPCTDNSLSRSCNEPTPCG